MKHASNRKPIFVLLTLLLCLCVFGALAFSASAQGELTVNVDFGADHEAYVQSCYGASGSFDALNYDTMQYDSVAYTSNGAVVSFQVDEGTTVYEAKNIFRSSFYTIAAEQNDKGQKRMSLLGLSPISDYSDSNSPYSEDGSAAVTDGQKLYVLWEQPAVVNVTVEPPVCGTEITFVNNYAAGGGNASPTSSPAPVITVTGDATLFRSPFHEGTDGFWCDNAQGDYDYGTPYGGFFTGTIRGGAIYYSTFYLEADFGYFLDSTSITVNDGVPFKMTDNRVTAAIPATHDGGDPVWTWANDCSLAVATLNCEYCGIHETRIAAIESQTTKEATATEDGEALFTATVVVNEQIFTDTRTLVLPATGTPEQPTEPGTPEQPTEPDTPANPSNGSGKNSLSDFFHKLFAWLIELFNILSRWIKK